MADVVIVGGGVVGLSLAYELARRGAEVELLERGRLGGEASWAGAGIVTPASREGAREPIDRLRAESVELTARWSHDLREETGIDNGYRPCGALEVAIEEEDRQAWKKSLKAWKAQGVPAHELEPAEAHRREPVLSAHLTGVYHLPTEAQIRNPWHLEALAAACRRRGVALREQSPVVEVLREEGKVKGLRTPWGRVEGDRYVIAAGAWAAALLEPLGLKLDAKPMRGQIALLKGPSKVLDHVVWAGHRYLVPRDEGRVLVGSTMEDAGFASYPTAAGIQGLLAFALRLAPGLADLEFEKAWAGLRPGSADGHPYLGLVPGLENLYAACGHYRAGFELAAGTALVMAQLLQGKEPAVPLDAFRVDR